MGWRRSSSAAIGAPLEIERIEPWAFDDDDSLEHALRALQSDDDGQGVRFVVGLIGALPKRTDSLHEVGVATLLGKHLVVRAAGRFEEDRAIDTAFDQLSEDARAGLLRARKRHAG